MGADTTIPVQPVGPHERGPPEPSAVATKPLAWLAGGVLIFLGAALMILGAVYSGEVPVKTVPAPQQFPAPRVETDEHDLLERLVAKQREALEGYSWANEQHTLVHIPVARAMALVAAEGQRAYDPVASLPGALAGPEAGAERANTQGSAR
jgi:hypothetical protein